MSNTSLFQQIWGNQQPTLFSLSFSPPVSLIIYHVYTHMRAVVMAA